VAWDVDTHDWRGDRWPSQPAQVRQVAARGGVVLLHDALVPDIGRTDAENTLEITDGLLRHAARHHTRARAFPDAVTADLFPDSPRPGPFGGASSPPEAGRRHEPA
jgi:hypothetical protein